MRTTSTNSRLSVVLCAALALVFTISLTVPLTARADVAVRFAAPQAAGSADCSSWVNACTLQAALGAAASGDQIWVREGVHKPTADPTNRWALFALKSGVAVYGGFAGTETSLDQRDWRAHPTILSGDIDNNDVNTDGNFITETTAEIVGGNSIHVVLADNVDSAALLDGFTITAGKADSNSGGGIVITNQSALSLKNLVVIGNLADSAGGMSIDGSSPSLNNISFINNTSGYRGGALYIGGSNGTTLTNAEFIGNASEDHGGAIWLGYTKYSGITISNALFYGNHAGACCGAIISDNTRLFLKNSTFSLNSSVGDPGVMFAYQSPMELANVIMWGNTSPANLDFQRDTDYYSPISIRMSDIHGCGASGTSWNSNCGTDLGGNIQSDPLFIDPANGNLRLQLTSPAIDAGDNTYLPVGITTDLDGNPRFVDIDTVTDSGYGTPPIVDLGAYEAYVDETHPQVYSIDLLDPTPTAAESVRFSVTFSEAVLGVDPADFDAQTVGISGAAVSGVSGGPVTYTVTVSTGSGSGSLGLVVPGTASVADLAGNALEGLPIPITVTYTIDKTAPAVVSILRADANPTRADLVNFTVTFSEPVSGVDSADFDLSVSALLSAAAVTQVTGSEAVYTVTCSTGSGLGTLGLVIPGAATISDLVGNALGGLPYESGEVYTILGETFLPVIMKAP